MNKILYVTTVGKTMSFFKSIINDLIVRGDSVDIATNEVNGSSPIPEVYKTMNCKVYSITCERNPFSVNSFKAIKQINNIVSSLEYSIVHCHTPVAAACTRIACRKLRKKNIRVFYTAHGFHFYKGAPIKNWVIYYPIEWLCSFFTDELITINTEDYQLAKNKFHAARTHYIPGVGVDPSKYADVNAETKIRAEFSIPSDDFCLLSVGELNDNKNHISVIKALKGLDNVTYIIAGKGKNDVVLKEEAAQCNVKLVLAGYRNDVSSFYKEADCYILPSHREGLNVSLMEAMGSSLPCLASDIRGNRDLIDPNGGLLFDQKSISSITDSIVSIMNLDSNKRRMMGEFNSNKIKDFETNVINRQMLALYDS